MCPLEGGTGGKENKASSEGSTLKFPFTLSIRPAWVDMESIRDQYTPSSRR